IIFIPGFTVPGESWDSTILQLQKEYECHVVTLAGFGGKAPIDFPWLPTVNQALEDYINEKKLIDVAIIGHSLGGTIAAWLASRENNKISEIILIDALPATGALVFPNFNPDNLKYDSPYNNQMLSMNEAEFKQMAQRMAQGMSLNAEMQKTIKDWIILADRKTYVYGYTDYLKLDLREDLTKISIPVTILAADKPYGKAMVTQTYKTQYTNLADYDLIITENSAHFVMFDRPEWFMEQIQEVLSTK
ncbi:MAG: alpha/beta hydrolase, partial [Bacteroidota bacterium]